MNEKTEPFQDKFQPEFQDEFEKVAETASKVKEEIDQFMKEFDLNSVVHRVEEFGRENPIGLALSALTLGLAAGFLIRNSKHLPSD